MSVPKQLGSYQLVAQLAIGGQCEVWLAKQKGPEGFARHCAIKLLRPERLHHPDARRALIAEARLVSRLDHPNLIRLFEFGHDPQTDHLFYSMPLIGGTTLLKAVPKARMSGRFSVADVLWSIEHIVSGLSYMHTLRDPQNGSLNIIHRDLSPENIMLSFDGQPIIIDMGIALSSIASRQTQNFKIKGKMQYLSPEQAQGERLDARTDIYAAGLLLYWMLTGHDALPAQSNDIRALELASAPRIVPPHRLVSMPHALSSLIMSTLSRDPAKRPQTAEILRRDIGVTLRQLAPEYDRAAYEANVRALLVPEREQHNCMLYNVSHNTQVIRIDEHLEEEIEDIESMDIFLDKTPTQMIQERTLTEEIMPEDITQAFNVLETLYQDED